MATVANGSRCETCASGSRIPWSGITIGRLIDDVVRGPRGQLLFDLFPVPWADDNENAFARDEPLDAR